jgi:hypothetical protein
VRFWEAANIKGEVTCRFIHVYPDAPAPYFSFHARGRHGALLEQWQAIKNAASDALIAAGGTITHHHAVGRDHRPWYVAAHLIEVRSAEHSGLFAPIEFFAFWLPAQPVDATQALNLSAGVSNCKVSLAAR